MLVHPPTPAELERLYFELAEHGGVSIGRHREWPYDASTLEELIALSGEMSRYDPRLVSIVLQLIIARWQQLNPLRLREAMREMGTPQALLVILEFVREATRNAELRYFIDYVSAGYKPSSPAQMFFFDAELPGSRMAARRDGNSLQAYRRWGFVGSERPTVSQASKATVGRYDAATRQRIRRRLGRLGTFQLADYMDAIDHGVSRTRAHVDLKSDPDFQVRGRGRGARWTMKPTKDGAR